MNKIIASLILLLVSAQVQAALEIIQLRHRSAEEVLPVIRPLLDQNDTASGMNYQLILRTSERNIEQIRELLKSIDVAPRRLKITVMQNVDSETAARLTEVSGNVRLSREARVGLLGSGNSGFNVEAARGQERLKARIDSSSMHEEGRNTQQLQVLEGNRALVRSGQSVPVQKREVIQSPWGTRVIDSTQYQEVASGFYVLPRINGDQVTLEISTENNSLAPGDGSVMRLQQTSTTISGRLGEWLEAGGLRQQQNGDDSTISMRGASRMREQRSILIRVEEIR